uniref:G-protein coupled receptors family 1 profile domain-containing protein n=1 Tax=Clytia hemisphaerica TaxID=252671 RepID=A0A7M5VAK1_9CNID
MLNPEFKSLNTLDQALALSTAIVGFIALLLNLICVIKIIQKQGFCIISTSGQIFMASLCGSNILIASTAITKELLIIFLANSAKIPKTWIHFEWYITIFCLISSTLHIISIMVSYLINTLMKVPKYVGTCGRVIDSFIISLIWTLSLLPAYFKYDGDNYKIFLNSMSFLLLSSLFVLVTLLVFILRCKQRTKSTNSNDETTIRRTNMIKTYWIRCRQKERIICLAMMASYLICSCPYMIYYPVLGKVYTSTFQPDQIDKILFMFILLKTVCDAVIYIIRKGWNREEQKVKFRINSPVSSSLRIPKLARDESDRNGRVISVSVNSSPLRQINEHTNQTLNMPSTSNVQQRPEQANKQQQHQTQATQQRTGAESSNQSQQTLHQTRHEPSQNRTQIQHQKQQTTTEPLNQLTQGSQQTRNKFPHEQQQSPQTRTQSVSRRQEQFSFSENDDTTNDDVLVFEEQNLLASRTTDV